MKKATYFLQILVICLMSYYSNYSNGKHINPDDSDAVYTHKIKTTSNTAADTNLTVTQPVVRKGPDVNARIALRTLWCNEKTELSHEDEIYLLIAGKKSDGTEYTNRLPTGLTWSLANSGGPSRQAMETKYGPIPNGYDLWSGSLKDGESVVINILFMEEDKSKAPARAELLADLVKNTDSNDPRAIAVAGIATAISKFFGQDMDDFVGAYAVKISNNNGNKNIDYIPLEGATLVGPNLDGKRIDVRGSGAWYLTTVTVY